MHFDFFLFFLGFGGFTTFNLLKRLCLTRGIWPEKPPRYIFRAYFWLDVIALISLLPDTWLFREIFESNQVLRMGT